MNSKLSTDLEGQTSQIIRQDTHFHDKAALKARNFQGCKAIRDFCGWKRHSQCSQQGGTDKSNGRRQGATETNRI